MPTLRTVTVKSTGGDYSSLNAAEAGEQADLVSLDRQLDIECYAFDDTTSCNFSGWTTDATRYIRVFTAAGEGHEGVWSTSKYRRRSSTGFGAGLTISEEYVRIEGIQCYQPSGTYTSLIRISVGNTSDVRVDRCLFSGAGAALTFSAIYMDQGAVAIRNSVIYGASDGIEWGMATGGTVVIDNCTVIATTYAILRTAGSITATVTNTYAHGGTDAYSSGTHVSLTTCMHSSATSFTGSTGSIAYDTSNFTNVTSGSEDLHLVSGSALIDQGTDLSGDFTTDIDGDTRGATWDIGADEFVSGGITVNGAITDGIKYSDLFAGSAISLASLLDGITESDSFSVLSALNSQLNEGIVLGNNYSVVNLALASILEGISLGDTLSIITRINVNWTEGLLLGDSQAVIASLNSALTNGLLLGDSFSVAAHFFTSLSETILLGDSESVIGALLSELSEGLLLGDTQSGTLAGIILASITEGLVLGDFSSATAELIASLSEGLILGDSLSGTKQTNVSTSEGLVFSESLIGLVGNFAQIIEGITLSDLFITSASLLSAINEGLILDDTFNNTAELLSNFTEGSIYGSAFTVNKLLQASIVEGLKNGDSWAVALVATASLTEGILLGDSVSASIITGVIQAAIAEGTKAGDVFAALLMSISNNIGAISSSDSFSAGLTASRSVSDGIVFSDSFSTILNTLYQIVRSTLYITRSLSMVRSITKKKEL